MKIITSPTIWIVSRQAVSPGLEGFLDEKDLPHTEIPFDSRGDGPFLAEAAGRLCYMSYGKGRKTNKEYLQNILKQAHGSVLEHAVWGFIIEGVSRSLTHELVRHRVGMSYSQLSQRYVDESDVAFVMPPAIQESTTATKGTWEGSMQFALNSYGAYVRVLTAKGLPRKQALEAARSVLPNATETKIFVTANARAIRHFIELRATDGADAEINRLAIMWLRLMQDEAPNLFGDYQIIPSPTHGNPNLEVAQTDYPDV